MTSERTRARLPMGQNPPSRAVICPGSSPRTWGTPLSLQSSARDWRFIPTHVGNAVCLAVCRVEGAVHPHARGERVLDSDLMITHSGSSPRTWGTHGERIEGPDLARFIPTHVGNARSRSQPSTTRTVHPHARGERAYAWAKDEILNGSSPRTWGTPHPAFECCRHGRFIPTHVGNADPLRERVRHNPVHPHARGERLSLISTFMLSDGSSPRTWGTPLRCVVQREAIRFIPTHVGNALRAVYSGPVRAVHPHARGERKVENSPGSSNRGSSPRTWGTL